MTYLATIALRYLLARKRQSLVSLMGIVLGTAFFLAISSLMQGSENDFLRRLVDNAPHITISDEFRETTRQPLEQLYPQGAVAIARVKTPVEPRGIRGFQQIITMLHNRVPGSVAAPVFVAEALVSQTGRSDGIVLNGMNPQEIRTATSIEDYMIAGSIDDLIADPNGVIIGAGLARKLSLSVGSTLPVSSASGQTKSAKVVGIFRVGREGYDASQVFLGLKWVQALSDRVNRVNRLIIKLPDPYQAHSLAAEIEKQIGYKSVSWQESSEDILNTLAIRNIIMYTVVSAVLVVAAFGIYNVISTVVLEKRRDIAVLKAIGFYATDIKYIFIIQGVILGLAGCFMGLPLGAMIMRGLMFIYLKPPGGTGLVQMPIDWSWPQFAIAALFALGAAAVAAFLPARSAAHVNPVDILRGSQ